MNSQSRPFLMPQAERLANSANCSRCAHISWTELAEGRKRRLVFVDGRPYTSAWQKTSTRAKTQAFICTNCSGAVPLDCDARAWQFLKLIELAHTQFEFELPIRKKTNIKQSDLTKCLNWHGLDHLDLGVDTSGVWVAGGSEISNTIRNILDQNHDAYWFPGGGQSPWSAAWKITKKRSLGTVSILGTPDGH